MGVFLATLHFLDNQRSVKSLTHLSRSAPLKSGPSEIDLTPLRGRRGTETRTSWARICLRERVPDIATCFAGSGGFLCDSSYYCRPACSRFIYRHRGSGIYLSIAGDRDGDALRQHCWRPDLVRQRLGSGVLLLSSEVQLFYF